MRLIGQVTLQHLNLHLRLDLFGVITQLLQGALAARVPQPKFHPRCFLCTRESIFVSRRLETVRFTLHMT